MSLAFESTTDGTTAEIRLNGTKRVDIGPTGIPISSLDGVAALAGSASQTFSGAAATAADHFVRKDQLNAPGRVVQVVVGTPTAGLSVSTTSGAFVVFGASGTITPTNALNKILVIASQNVWLPDAGGELALTIARDGTDLSAGDGLVTAYTPTANSQASHALSIYDAPASTSAITYSVRARVVAGAGAKLNGVRASNRNTITLMEIAV